MTVFLTADQHFGHSGIIGNADRPFAGVDEMDEVLIANWNRRIRPDSVVYHLGDFAHKCPPARLRTIWNRLTKPKAIHLVPGNHDDATTLSLPWTSVTQGILTMSASNRRFSLFHYALRTWPGIRRGAIHAYGHSHNRMPGFRNTLDVGVDAWGFAPASVDEVIKRAGSLPEFPFGEPEDDEDGDASAAGGEAGR
ncbi:metallophosphoesterase [Methylobacterium fujisawaense]|jgi:calcineurin-like phosphoesterase family protein